MRDFATFRVDFKRIPWTLHLAPQRDAHINAVGVE